VQLRYGYESAFRGSEKLCGSLLVEAPCFSRGSWTLVQRKKESILKWALAPGFGFPALKRVIKIELFSGALKRSSPA
jgi:hypothetical protein